MTLHTIQIALQAVSSFAIAAGFLYTAIQFHQWRKAQHVANFAKLVEMQMQLRRMRVEDPSLGAVYRHDVEGMTSDREIREYFMNLMQVSIFEIVWFSHRLGQLPDDYYESWVERMKAIQQEESFQRMVARPSMKILHDEFQKYIQEMARSAAGTAAVPKPGKSGPRAAVG
jgi:hypothetical protein